jgi:hypothetical protein
MTALLAASASQLPNSIDSLCTTACVGEDKVPHVFKMASYLLLLFCGPCWIFRRFFNGACVTPVPAGVLQQQILFVHNLQQQATRIKFRAVWPPAKSVTI